MIKYALRQAHALAISYLSGIKDRDNGNSYATILALFVPELVTALVLMMSIVDAHFVAQLNSTALYTALGVTYTLLHTVIKIAEGLSVGGVILCGHYNGADDRKKVGTVLSALLWTAALLGGVVAGALFFGAHAILGWYHIPDKLVSIGAGYLQVRCISVFFLFMSYAIIGFLRGIKNTRLPMNLFFSGAFLFLVADYLLIFGKCGLPQLGILGSAWAAVLQYAVIATVGLIYVLKNYSSVYYVPLFSRDVARLMGTILVISFPVMVDKAILAIAKMWLCALVNPLGKVAMGTFHVIKDMEQFAFVPAIAFAQVVTLLVSNDYGSKNWLGIKSTIKKVLFLSSVAVFTVLAVFSCMPHTIIGLFDSKHVFTEFAANAFPFISVLVFFDVLQLTLAAALRGASNVRVVMLVRAASFILFFVPVSYGLSLLPLENMLIKFILIYSSFYITNGLMGVLYLYRFRSEGWKRVAWRS